MLEKQFRFIVMMIISLCFGIQDITKQDEINLTEINNEMDITKEPWKHCDLEWEEMPMPEYFTNVNQTYYNYTTKGDVAAVIMDYVLDAGMEDEQWALKSIYHNDDDIYQAYTESDMGSELYILFLCDTPDAKPCYIIAADIRKSANEDTVFHQGKYSYNSMLEWYSYKEWFDGGNDTEETIEVNVNGYLYDACYGNHSYYAIYDYLDRFGGDKDIPWEIDENMAYVGSCGSIASIPCVVGTEKIYLFLDIWNKRYAVFK